ncbi:MAG: fibronectin type III domain-containing protein [Nanobdellota archaeon]
MVFNWSVSDNNVDNLSCDLFVDDVLGLSGSFTPGEQDITQSVNVSEDGEHSWRVFCSDNFENNYSTGSRTFTIDVVSPEIELNFPKENSVVSSSEINFNWTVFDDINQNVTCNLNLDGDNEISGMVVQNNTYASYEITGLSDGNHYWNVSCIDRAQNQIVSGTRSFEIDTVAPSIISQELANLTDESATINWETSEASNSTLYYGLSENKLNNSIGTLSGTDSYSVNLQNLKEQTPYYYYVRVCDSAENCFDSETFNFTTGENYPPSIDGFIPFEDPLILKSSSQEFEINASDMNNDIISITWMVNDTVVGNGNSYTFNGVNVSGEKHFQVKAVISDGVNNRTNVWDLTQKELPEMGHYSGQTTNLSEIHDLSNVDNFTIENDQGGMIKWSSSVDLTQMPVIDSFINIAPNMIAVDSSNLEGLSGSATIYMYNLSYSRVPQIYYNEGFTTNSSEVNEPCPSDVCSNIIFNKTTGTLKFDVSHFSVFRTVAATKKKSSTEEIEKEEEKEISRPIKLPHLRFLNEEIMSGDVAELSVELNNMDKKDIDNVKITVVFPEIGVRMSEGPFELDNIKNTNRVLSLAIPQDVSPGLYIARITVTGDDGRIQRRVHRHLRVI